MEPDSDIPTTRGGAPSRRRRRPRATSGRTAPVSPSPPLNPSEATRDINKRATQQLRQSIPDISTERTKPTNEEQVEDYQRCNSPEPTSVEPARRSDETETTESSETIPSSPQSTGNTDDKPHPTIPQQFERNTKQTDAAPKQSKTEPQATTQTQEEPETQQESSKPTLLKLKGRSLDAPAGVRFAGEHHDERDTKNDDEAKSDSTGRVQDSATSDSNNNIDNEDARRQDQRRARQALASSASLDAVRILFREAEPTLSPRPSAGTQVVAAGRTRLVNSRPPTTPARSTSLVAANRRLMERQLGTIQAADSQRWNFDFRNCRPLGQAGHRFVHCTEASPTGAADHRGRTRACRPLNDQNRQSSATNFEGQP